LPLGLILNEMLTNSIKYAYANKAGGEIRVSLLRQGHNAILSVADDGPGFPPTLDPDTSSSTGMMIMHMLAKQLKAKIRLQSLGGAKISVIFPI